MTPHCWILSGESPLASTATARSPTLPWSSSTRGNLRDRGRANRGVYYIRDKAPRTAIRALGGLQEERFAAQAKALGDAPGVAALGVRGGEEFGLAGAIVGGNAVVERRAEVGERSLRIAAVQVQPSALEQQVDVVDAVAAVAGDLQAVGEGGGGLGQPGAIGDGGCAARGWRQHRRWIGIERGHVDARLGESRPA